MQHFTMMSDKLCVNIDILDVSKDILCLNDMALSTCKTSGKQWVVKFHLSVQSGRKYWI